jgi:GNAT superfamily N-acetyltransferase
MNQERAVLFGSVVLAARIERAATALVSGGAEVARTRSRGRDLPVVLIPLAGGAAIWAGEASPLNKVVGLGFAGVPSVAELEAVERAFDERGAQVQIELANLAERGISELLTRRGYCLAGFENVLGAKLPLAWPRAIATGIDVRESSLAELDRFLDVVIEGFAHPDGQGVPSHVEFPRAVLDRVTRDFASVPGNVRYLARRGGEIAGGANLCMSGGVAQFAGAATHPAHRRRGVQSALLLARLAHATSAGCDIAVVTTQPGSKSQENVQRQGFDLLYTRAMLVRQR